MFCPRCGQEQNSPESRFCSRCGFPMTGVGELLASGGTSSALSLVRSPKSDTPRTRGLKQGLFIFLLSFLVVPLIAILTAAIDAEPFGVVIAAILLTVGGILRAVYALMFQSNAPREGALGTGDFEAGRQLPGNRQTATALPPQQSVPVDSYAPPVQGSWRETNDLTPSSVTERTTRLLQKDK